MANRRMFSKTVIDSDLFLDLPLSSQSLYFHLAMRADDEGFLNNAKNIRKMLGASEDDLKLLIAKGFLIWFDSGVCVIRHWDVHNYIRGDRKKNTSFSEERDQLSVSKNGEYMLEPVCQVEESDSHPQENVGQLPDTCLSPACHRLGKGRLSQDKDRGGKGKGGYGGEPRDEETETAASQPAPPQIRIPYAEIQSLYNDTCVSLPRCTILSDARKKAIKARFVAGYTLEQFQEIFRRAEASSFLKGANGRNWTASFDWIIKDANMAKILSGNYDDHAQVVRVSRGSGPGDRSSRQPTVWEDLPDGFLD